MSAGVNAQLIALLHRRTGAGRLARVAWVALGMGVDGLLLTVLLAGCSTPTAAPFLVSKEQVIARANQDAQKSVPELGTRQARIDSVVAELITLGEADQRMGGQRGPSGYGPGQTPQSLVWWVVVRGYFQYEGMAAPPNPPPICEADERDFIYDAQTGESIGERMPNTRCALPSVPGGSAGSAMTAASRRVHQ